MSKSYWTILLSCFILLGNTYGQVEQHKFEIGVTGLVTSYNYDLEWCRCDYKYFGIGPRNRVFLNQLYGKLILNDKISVQLGIQYFDLNFANEEYIVTGFTSGVDQGYIKDFDFNISVKKNFLDIPVSLVYNSKIDDRFSFDIKFGLAPTFNLGHTTTIVNKESNKTESSASNKFQFEKTISPQLNFEFVYSVNSKINLSLATIYKFRTLLSINKWFLGGGLGINYKFEKTT